MSPTPEARAEAIAETWSELSVGAQAALQREIAAAIRAAENDAIGRTAQEAERRICAGTQRLTGYAPQADRVTFAADLTVFMISKRDRS